jgi:hypothetical protein
MKLRLDRLDVASPSRTRDGSSLFCVLMACCSSDQVLLFGRVPEGAAEFGVGELADAD